MRQLKITRTVNNSTSEGKTPTRLKNDECRNTSEEEIELIQKAKQGDTESINKIVNSNHSNIISIARQYLNNGLSLEELITEGKKGLLKSLDTFDETCGFKFISYAVWWIRQSMINAIEEKKKSNL